jgi:uncharacterized protein
MAQASSAQREPSMEEILASIRRIIEDSESGRKDEPAARDPFAPAAEVESFRSELRPLPQSREGDDAGEQDLRPQQPSEETFEGATDVAFDDEFDGEHSSVLDAGDHDDGDDMVVPVAANSPIAAPAPQEDLSGWEPKPSAPALQPEPIDHERRGILSELPGRKVAAAFEELNEALLANRRKTLDQLAEEMLRPMLQDWLDNNLPRMVERLVREEIERIARGA